MPDTRTAADRFQSATEEWAATMLTGLAIRRAATLAALLSAVESQAQGLSEVALAYLQRHGVPCLFVATIERAVQEFDLIATCQDGRRWALYFFEGEVAFLQPTTGEPYKWRREVYESYPEIYVDQNIQADHIRHPLSKLLERLSANQ